MTKISPLPPSGFRDFTPSEASARAFFIETISKIYQTYGFQPISTAAMENLSTLTGKGGGADNEKLIFKILKRGDELEKAYTEGKHALADLGMRFDLTLPLARYYARHRSELPKPFKVFNIGPVWRADRPQKGRYREFFQCDADIIGAQEIGAEYECISAITDVFLHFGFNDIEVHINDRRLLAAIGKHLGVGEKEWSETLITLDKLDKIGVEGVKKELTLSSAQIAELEKLLLTETTVNDAVMDSFQSIDTESTNSIKELLALLQNKSGLQVVFNPTLVRGQDYYTGTIFEIRHKSISGSLGGGGRYNRLLEIFGAESTPAFGGSIGFERLLLLVQEKGILTQYSSVPQVFFPVFSANLRGKITELAGALRSAGLRVDVFPDAAKLKNQFKYADDRKIPFVAILGEEELSKSEIKVKNMQSRSEESISLNDFVQKMEQLCRT